MKKQLKVLGVAAVALCLSVALVASSGASAAPGADTAKKKCKKKNKKKCKKRLPVAVVTPPVTPAPAPAPAPAITLRCADCAPYDDMGTIHPIAHDSDSLITFTGTVSPVGRGAVTFTYDVGDNPPATTVSPPVDGNGNFTVSFTLNHQDQLYTNTVSANYAGLVSTSAPVFVY